MSVQLADEMINDRLGSQDIGHDLPHDDSCVAYRLHNALINLNFTTHAMVGEIVSMQITPYFALLMALAIACLGHMFLRPSLCMLGFSAGTMASLHVFFVYSRMLHNWPCDSVVIASVVVGAITALICSTLAHSVSIILGAVAGGSLVMLFFDICQSCNDEPWLGAPTMLGRSLVPFWLVFSISAGIGGFVCRQKEKKILAIVTSIIGGWGVAASVRLAVGAQNQRMPGWAHLLVAMGSGGVGFAVQLTLMTKLKRRREQARQISLTQLQPPSTPARLSV